MTKYVADTGINWIFVYEVLHEDAEIIVLKDRGRFHKFDADSKFTGQIDEWIDFNVGNGFVRVGHNPSRKLLVEVKQ